MMRGDVADGEVRLNKGLLVSGAVLVGIGGFLGGTGLLLGTTAIASAMRKWVRQIDHSPAGAARQ